MIKRLHFMSAGFLFALNLKKQLSNYIILCLLTILVRNDIIDEN